MDIVSRVAVGTTLSRCDCVTPGGVFPVDASGFAREVVVGGGVIAVSISVLESFCAALSVGVAGCVM